MTETTHCKPNADLSSILRQAPVGPSAKLQAVCLLRGETFTELARRLGINRVTFSMMVNGRLVAPAADRIKKAVANDLGVAIEDVWTSTAQAA